ncbi:WD40 repeat domain-containing protein [Armatimonas rosea]|uniref:Uncharacterized protein n=1 Tax=Armatimonas rosea TaxID=685828 RepID=A0A7W9SW09_ARMRO|nr:hypothetical protein [Armatimonas rosea]MBB6053244.1 hypothetical protein [Armatimonas rosea]
MRLTTNTPTPTTQTQPTSQHITAPTPVVAASTVLVTTGARTRRRRSSSGHLVLWGTLLVPVVALGLALRPAVQTQLVERRLAPRQLLAVLPGTETNGMALSANGRYMAVRSLKLERGSGEGIAWLNQTQVYDTGTGKQLGTVRTPDGTSSMVGITADGTRIVTAEYGNAKKNQGQLSWWDVASGKPINTVTYPSTTAENLLSVAGTELLESQDGVLTLRSTETGALLARFPIPSTLAGQPTNPRCYQLALSPNSQWVAARVSLKNSTGLYGLVGAELVLWKRGEQKPRWSFPVREHNAANTVMVANDGTVLATVEKVIQDARQFINLNDAMYRGVICLDATTGKERWFIPHGKGFTGLTYALAIDPARNRVALRYGERFIGLHRLTDGSLISTIDTRQKISNGGVLGERVRFSDDGKTLYDRQVGGIAVWSLEGLK